MKKTLQALVILLMAIAFISCQKESTQPYQVSTGPQILPPPDGGRAGGGTGTCPDKIVSLVAGQTINSGSVNVTNDSEFIYVTYTTTNGWTLTQTHLYVGACALIPVNGPGNPMPGQFPYSTTHANITSYTYQIPISALSMGTCGCIAAHAVVVQLDQNGNVIQTQTGWGNGTRINPNGGNWGMKFDYCSCTL